MGVADSALDLTIIPGATADGNTATTHAGTWGAYGSGDISYNGSLVTGGLWTAGVDTLQVALDRVNKIVWFGKNNTWLNGDPTAGTGGLAMSSIGASLYPYLQAGFSHTVTGNFGTTPGGTSGFAYTPPTNGTTRVFVAP
jgi:hypothetical protein